MTVKREGTRLMAPGIGDDTRGLALMLSLMRAMDAGGIRTQRDVLFVGTVGEEGDGDLRGVKYLFRQGRYKDRVGQFISLDFHATTEWPIINGALGVKRYRVTFKGPGGHSFNAFGLVNPGLAMAGAMARLGRLSVPERPKTAFNVGVVGGGTSVNSIPIEMYMDVDLRSESPSELARLEDTLRAFVREAVDEENRRSRSSIRLSLREPMRPFPTRSRVTALRRPSPGVCAAPISRT